MFSCYFMRFLCIIIKIDRYICSFIGGLYKILSRSFMKSIFLYPCREIMVYGMEE